AVSDFDYELQMAQMNREIGQTETVFMATNPLYSFLSSRLVKEVMRYGGDVSSYVPKIVREAVAARLAA
ncbi:MAG: pantetheine-phosphate adenylyltransferase, partial [Terriglobales bacterium]